MRFNHSLFFATSVLPFMGCEVLKVTSCFVAGTSILTDTGAKPIEVISVGDMVWSFSTENNQPVLRSVRKTLRNQATRLHSLRAGDFVVDGVSDEHPFYNPSQKKWVKAKDLQKGDMVLVLLGQAIKTVAIDTKSTRVLPDPVEVYNLTVEGPEHNYFANGILVHNKSVIEPIDESPSVSISLPLNGEQVIRLNEVDMLGFVYDNLYNADELSIQWFIGDDPVCADAILELDGTTKCTAVFTEVGESLVTLEASNPMDLTDAAMISVIVYENEMPEGEIISPTVDGEYFSDTPILFSAEVADDLLPPDALLVEWESDIDGALGSGTADSSGLFAETYMLSQGQHQITLRVSEQQVTEKTIMITVF